MVRRRSGGLARGSPGPGSRSTGFERFLEPLVVARELAPQDASEDWLGESEGTAELALRNEVDPRPSARRPELVPSVDGQRPGDDSQVEPPILLVLGDLHDRFDVAA